MDSMPDGGRLVISTGVQGKGEERMAVIRVQDTGRGISRKNMEMVFEPFYTTKGAEHGTGLGLAITRKNLEFQKGSVAIESEVGKGTEVILSLPFIKHLT